MKTRLFNIIFSLLTTSVFAQSLSPESNTLVDQLEYAFDMRTIQHIEEHLSEDFTINEYGTSFSRQMLAGLILELPIKKIKAREVLSLENNTTKVQCKMVIAKYFGIFSQPIELLLIQDGNKQIIQHMALKGQGDEAVGVQMEVGDGNTNVEKKVILEALEKLETDAAPTYYEEGMVDFAKKAHQIQVDGLDIVRSVLGEEILFKIGFLVLKDSLSSLSIAEVVIPITTDVKSDEEKEIIEMMVNWVYFHEATELHLLLGKGIMDPKTRWFRDGLADFVAHNVAKELNPLVDSMVLDKRRSAYEKIKGEAQLLKWIGTGSQKKQIGIEGGSGQYAAAMFFFIELTEKYGNNVIPELMSSLKNHKKIKSKTLIKELSRITGGNIKEMLKAY